MLRATSFTCLSTMLQSLIDTADEDKVDADKSDSNETNLSNPFASKRSIEAGYLTFEGVKKGGNNSKKGGGNTKKSIKAARGFDYLTSEAKKAFNHF